MNAIDAPATIASCAVSLRELGEMLERADQHPDFYKRLDEVELLTVRAQLHVNTLKDLLVAAHQDAMGIPPAGRRPPHGGYPDRRRRS